MFTKTEIVLLATALTSAAYSMYVNGRIKEAIEYKSLADKTLMVVVLIPAKNLIKLHKYQASRSFKTYSLFNSRLRFAIARRTKKAIPFSFYHSPNTTFQFHLHFGKVSMYLSINSQVIDKDRTWYGKDIINVYASSK